VFDDLASGYGTRGWATRGLSRSDFVPWHFSDVTAAFGECLLLREERKVRIAGPISVFVQVFGCRHDEAIHAVRRPASEKRQGTKSRESGAPAVPRALMEI